MGISLALNEKLSIKEGRVVQTNYDQYKITRMKHTPEIEIEIVESSPLQELENPQSPL